MARKSFFGELFGVAGDFVSGLRKGAKPAGEGVGEAIGGVGKGIGLVGQGVGRLVTGIADGSIISKGKEALSKVGSFEDEEEVPETKEDSR